MTIGEKCSRLLSPLPTTATSSASPLLVERLVPAHDDLGSVIASLSTFRCHVVLTLAEHSDVEPAGCAVQPLTAKANHQC